MRLIWKAHEYRKSNKIEWPFHLAIFANSCFVLGKSRRNDLGKYCRRI